MLIDRKHGKVRGEEAERLLKVPMKFFATHRRSAMRFRIEDQVIAKLSGLVDEYPDTFLRNYQFAKPCYDTMYVEFNHRAWTNGIKRSHMFDRDHDDVDMTVGYMIHDGMVGVIANSTTVPDPMVLPLFWSTNYRQSSPGREMFPVMWPPVTMAAAVLGATFNYGNLTNEMLDDIYRRITLWMPRGIRKEYLVNFVERSAGEMRTMMSILLWLNQPHKFEYIDVPTRHGMSKRGPVVYLKHTIVRLHPGVTTKAYYRALVQGVGTPKRRHETRACYHHWPVEKKDHCINALGQRSDDGHDWPIMPDEKEHWTCRRCGLKRRWWSKYMAGTAEVGVVKKDMYLVTP